MSKFYKFGKESKLGKKTVEFYKLLDQYREAYIELTKVTGIESKSYVPYLENLQIKPTENDKEKFAASLCKSKGNKGKRRSEQTRRRMSEAAKERFKIKSNHPSYKKVNIFEIINKVKNGMTVKDACAKYNITKSTYYKKRKEAMNE